MKLGKQMQFFGARVNLAKALLYAINGGRDEISGDQIAPATPPVTSDVLDYDEVFEKFDHTMEWLARTYVHAMNCIHYMHDKYFYERLEMALHDRDILRTMAFGIAGLSVVADSLCGDQVRQGARDPRRDRACRRLPHREQRHQRGSAVRQQRRPGRQHRRRPRHAVHAEDPQAPDLSQRDPHPERADDHLERGLRQGTPATRPTAAARASRSGRAPTRCTAATAMAGSRPACRSRSCPTRMRWTASATPSRSRRRRRTCPTRS